MPRCKHEQGIQRSIMDWWRIQKPGFNMHASPNGGSRHPREATNLKKDGVTAGVADLALMLPGGRTAWVEVKRPATYKMGKRGKLIIDKPAGKLEPPQKEFKKECERLGHPYFVVYSSDEFLKVVGTLI